MTNSPTAMPKAGVPPGTRATRARAQRMRAGEYPVVLGRCWLVANLLGVAAVGAALGDAVPLALAGGWSAFVVLNAALYLASRSGHFIGTAAAHSAGFNFGLAIVTGLAWGAGVAALIPLADPGATGVLLCAAFGVALVAIPVFSAEPRAFGSFLTALLAFAVLGILSDARYQLSTLWLVPAGLTLMMMSSVYYRSFDDLRGILHRFVGVAEAAEGDAAIRSYPNADLPAVARRKLVALSDAFGLMERNRRVLRALGDAVVTTDANGVIDFVNPVAEVLLGGDFRDLERRPVSDCLRIVFPPDHSNHAQEIFDQCRLSKRAQISNDNAQLIRRDGVVYGIDYVVTPISNDESAFAGSAFLIRDVTERRHRAETIAWQATHDPLTGAINRTEFEIRLKKLVRRAQDDKRHVHSLLYIDADKFKFVNDSYGHAAGDSALKALADILRNKIRGADTLARVGGDEFTALLYSCSGDKARLIAESVRVAVDKHEFTWQSIELPISISVGIVEINADCRSAAEIIRAADAACYAAKKFGRNRVHVFEREFSSGSKQARVFDFVKDIQTAIQGNRLELFYQPLCPAANPEGSDRCELSVGVRNSAGEFIPRAEVTELCRRYQLAEDIDRWVVKAALDALRLNHPTLSGMQLVLLPLSQQSVADDRLLDYIVRNMHENKEFGNRIGFVFDEPGLAGHLDYVRYFVTSLKQFGCHFMISDSGFGSESIDLMKSLQADYLGIRGQLVQNMLYSSVDYEVVLGLSRIARSLGMQTVAEGADTRPIRDALAKMGIGWVKGQLNEDPKPISIHSEAQWI